jgi:hypothetical protein
MKPRGYLAGEAAVSFKAGIFSLRAVAFGIVQPG